MEIEPIIHRDFGLTGQVNSQIQGGSTAIRYWGAPESLKVRTTCRDHNSGICPHCWM